MQRTALSLLTAVGGALALAAPAPAASRCDALEVAHGAANTRVQESRDGAAADETRCRVSVAAAAVTARAGGLAVHPNGADAADLKWDAARDGEPVRAYRVLRDGSTLREVTERTLTVPVTAEARRYQVAAVTAEGGVGPPSPAVTVQSGHTAPAAPAAPSAASVTDTTVALTWARPAGSELRGYRLMRDGAVVAQVAGERATVGNLAPKATYGWSVAAVDTRGYVSAASPVTSVAQAEPPPTTGNAHAFLLASTDASYAAFRRHYRQIGTVYPTFWDCRTDTAAIEGRNDAPIVSYAQDRKVKVLPRFNCQHTATLTRILNEPAVRTTWLDGMTDLVERYGYDGLNVDFEAVRASDRAALTSFISDLAARLHARGKLLSQAVSAKTKDIMGHPRSTAFDYVELSKHLDSVFVMAWGIHWATSGPGAQDDAGWVRQVADYVASLPRKEKFVLGTMLYGMDWPNGGGTATPATARYFGDITALSERHGAAPVYDPAKDSWQVSYRDEAGVPREVWYSDATVVGNRVALARERGLGVGFWRLGQEDERLWQNPLVGGAR